MKKNTRIVSMAAAALLAVAPVAASAVPVNAAASNITLSGSNSTASNTGTTSTAKPVDTPYFTYGNEVVSQPTSSNPNANVIRTTVNISNGQLLSDVVNQLNKLDIKYHASNDNAGKSLDLTAKDVYDVLQSNGVTFRGQGTGSTPASGTRILSVPSTAFNLKIANGNVSVQVPITVSGNSSSSTTDADAPVFNWSLNGQQQSSSLNGQIFQVAVGSSFNPQNFTNSNGEQVVISASQTKNNSTLASVSASNPVNTSEAGRYYNVTLTATGLTGKKTTATYMVLITSSQKQTLYANGASSIPTYNIYGINVESGSTTFKDGEQVYVADKTVTIGGVSYSQVSTKSKSDANSSNIWVKTSSLVKPAGDTNTKTLPVMVDSRAYDKNGNYLGHMYYAYDNIDIVPTVVTIKGKTYYKVANKDEYVRVTNITGNQRTLKHNAYIYWSSYRRTPGTGKMYRGQTVTTYGGQMRFKNGKKYYRIEGCRNNNKRYIKAVNFY